MILIFSNEIEASTDAVIKWLISFGKSVIRVNDGHPIEIIKVELSSEEVIFKIDTKVFFLSDIEAIWYRRGGFNIKYEPIISDMNKIKENFNIKSASELSAAILLCVNNDMNTLRDYIIYLFSKKKHINMIDKSSVNKLIVLSKAKEVGLNIPESFVCTDIIQVNNLLYNSGGLITKAMRNGIYEWTDTEAFYSYTESINTIMQENDLKSPFMPTLIQKQIKKKYELRVFYLLGTCYAMAIFTQNNTATAVDSRKYDNTSPNRCIPYSMNKKDECMIKDLMNKLDLNCGSIDFIVDEDYKLFFLEVNPVGQFMMTSVTTNYYLQKKIAENLIS